MIGSITETTEFSQFTICFLLISRLDDRHCRAHIKYDWMTPKPNIRLSRKLCAIHIVQKKTVWYIYIYLYGCLMLCPVSLLIFICIHSFTRQSQFQFKTKSTPLIQSFHIFGVRDFSSLAVCCVF